MGKYKKRYREGIKQSKGKNKPLPKPNLTDKIPYIYIYIYIERERERERGREREREREKRSLLHSAKTFQSYMPTEVETCSLFSLLSKLERVWLYVQHKREIPVTYCNLYMLDGKKATPEREKKA